MKNDGLDIVDGPAPSEMEKEAAHGIRAGEVGAPDTRDSFSPPMEKKR
jgi:hypothetical protein